MTARVVLAGGSGYLGSHLTPRLVAAGYDVVVLTRRAPARRNGVRFVHWDGRSTSGRWVDELAGAAAVVNLAGRSVDTRPTPRNIDELARSRVEPTAAIGTALGLVTAPPPVWVQLSTLAIHGDAGEEVVDDHTPPPTDGPRQMVAVASAWEDAFRQARGRVERAVALRLGIVIGGDDPATRRLTQLARCGLAGPVAGGRQWVSWIALADAMRVIERSIEDPTMRGTYVACAPRPVRNDELMRTVRAHVGRTLGLPAPAALVSLGAWLLGSDPQLALTGRRGRPRRLLEEGFRFEVEHLARALAAPRPVGVSA